MKNDKPKGIIMVGYNACVTYEMVVFHRDFRCVKYLARLLV
jgi:hypothetical protein